MSGLIGIVAIASGGHFSLALRNDGTVWAWGDNSSGQLGGPSTDTCSWAGINFACSRTPIQVPNVNGIVAVAAGDEHSLALRSDGTVWAWGYGAAGQTAGVQGEVPGLTGVTAIAAGIDHSLALKSDGSV